MTDSDNKLRIIPLGGIGEVGKNMTAIEYGDDMIVVDCGLIFPDEDMLGIDLVIPDMSYIEERAHKLRAFVITHGHEDHIGALPYALKKFHAPVFATDLTLALIEHKLDESNVDEAQLITIAPDRTINLGCFTVEFIRSTHSIPGAVMLAVSTPVGTIIHTGDFKLDFTPIDGEITDITRLGEYGKSGVLLLLSDSTNAENEGYTPSEKDLGSRFEEYFTNAQGRVIVASFASNIYRIQQIADVAIAHGRVICFQGRSMIYISEIARRLGYLNISGEHIVELSKLDNIPDNEVCIITTGSQGEPMSGLFRMANSSHKLNIGENDTVIISASAIPGNEVGIAKVINQFYNKGAKVIYDPMADVHVSGHAKRKELTLLLALVKPKFFIPIHGEYKHMHQHALLAQKTNIPPENIFELKQGEALVLDSESAEIEKDALNFGSVYVDGLGVGDIGSTVIKDRKIMSEDGVVMAIITINKVTGALMADPEVITRGFIYPKIKESDEIMCAAKENVLKVAYKYAETNRANWSSIKNAIRSTLKDYLYEKTKRHPIIIPVIIEV
ncbi:MAG: ribonuclease J [Clostridia bacterium]|nr:ribonuclease J [Clostridia bacterium]